MVMSQNYNDNDVVIFGLIRRADIYYKNAKKLVLSTLTKEGSKRYKDLIKLSIKGLKLVLIKYGKFLTPEIKSLVLMKLSKIYYEETENYEAAEILISDAIKVCKTNRLMKFEIISHILLIKILYKTDKIYCETKLKDLLDYFISSPNIFAIFWLLKYRLFKSSFEVTQNIESTIKQCDDDLKAYVMLTVACHSLNNNDLKKYEDCFKEIQPYFNKFDKLNKTEIYYKLRAMAFFMQFIIAYLTGDSVGIDKVLTTVAPFGNNAKQIWKKNDPNFILKTKISETFLDQSFVKFRVCWLCNEQFLALTYMFMGIVSIYGRGLPKAISGASHIIKLHNDNFKLNAVNPMHKTLNINHFKLSLLNFESYYQKTCEISKTISFYVKWDNFLQNKTIELSDLRTRSFNSDFEIKFARKVDYLGALTHLSLPKVDFEMLINKLKSLIEGPSNDLTIYSLLQLANVLNWNLELAKKSNDIPTSSHLSNEIREISTMIDKNIPFSNSKTERISGGFSVFISKNPELQALILSITAIFGLSTTWHSHFKTRLNGIERGEIRSLYVIVFAGLVRALLAETSEEFGAESSYVSKYIKNSLSGEKFPISPSIRNGTFKHVATCAADTFSLYALGRDKEKLKRNIQDNYVACIPYPEGFCNYFAFLTDI